MDAAKQMRVDLQHQVSRGNPQQVHVIPGARFAEFLVDHAAVFFVSQLDTLAANPLRYSVEQLPADSGSSGPAAVYFSVKRRMGPNARKFLCIFLGLEAACTCADATQRFYVCRHIIAAWLSLPGNSLDNLTPLLSFFGARHQLSIARELVDRVWPMSTSSTEPAISSRVIDVTFSDLAASLTPEYRDNLLNNLLTGLSTTAECLPDIRFMQLSRAVLDLMANFGSTSRSSIDVSSTVAEKEDIESTQDSLILLNPAPVGRAATRIAKGDTAPISSKRKTIFSEQSRSGQRKVHSSRCCAR